MWINSRFSLFYLFSTFLQDPFIDPAGAFDLWWATRANNTCENDCTNTKALKALVKASENSIVQHKYESDFVFSVFNDFSSQTTRKTFSSWELKLWNSHNCRGKMWIIATRVQSKFISIEEIRNKLQIAIKCFLWKEKRFEWNCSKKRNFYSWSSLSWKEFNSFRTRIHSTGLIASGVHSHWNKHIVPSW